MIRFAPVLFAATLWLAPAPATAGEDGDPANWLARMNAALNQMDYQGTFVYMLGDSMETMRITHVAGADGVRERITSLSGPSREVVRDADGVRWVQGADQPVLADGVFKRTFFPELPRDPDALVAGNYLLKFGGVSRIAGHETRQVRVVPRDNYRYGYSFWMERHSGLLLKWELLDSDRRTLSRLMFTEIRLGSEVDAGELRQAERLKRAATVETGLPAGRVGAGSAPRWAPARMPPGFELAAHRVHGDGERVFEHLVYSDGLAALSIYVESAPGAAPFQPAVERHGTAHSYARPLGDVVVTVVGDVPALTVRTVGESVRLVSP